MTEKTAKAIVDIQKLRKEILECCNDMIKTIENETDFVWNIVYDSRRENDIVAIGYVTRTICRIKEIKAKTNAIYWASMAHPGRAIILHAKLYIIAAYVATMSDCLRKATSKVHQT